MGKTHVVKWFFGVFILCLLILGCGFEVDAATYLPEEIGTSTSDTSIVGVNLYCDDRLLYYVHDIWQKNDNAWVNDLSNNNGYEDYYSHETNNSNLIWILNPENERKRFGINLTNVFKKCGGTYEDYSVIIEHRYKNKLICSYLETPFDDMDSYYQNLSLMYACKNDEYMVKVTSYSATSASYNYKLYKILRIKQDGDIKVASGNWSVTDQGDAYYDGNQYIIHSLPQVTPAFEGYTCSFDGWYSAATGGKKYAVGDVIEKGATIYPHWTKTPNTYPIQCIDILGKNSSGLKLGESTWMQDYGSVAVGSRAGCIPTESMYYEGTEYTGCSQCTVGVSGNVVYRYFDYAEYPVQIVDRVALGPNTGKELGRTSRQGRYQTSISGSVLGTDFGVGVYYQGYYYQQSTSSVIGKEGVTVYRNFVPVQYDIVLHGNGASNGSMDGLQGCWYDQKYTLIPNSYQKEIRISFDLQAENAVCDNREKKVLLPWKGWAESSTGGVRYSDQASVQNLSINGEKKNLYAVWDPAEVTITSVPQRMGYIFAGWSKDPGAVSGNTEFRLHTDTTLYAIWKPDIVNYHVEYYKEEPDGSFQMTTQYQFSNYTDSMIYINDIIPDYQGYYLDRGSSTLQGMVQGDGSLVLMAYYRRNSYQVNFEGMIDGETLQPLQGVYEQTVQIPDFIPKRKGYQFKGWTADPESTQVYCMPGDSYRIPNHNQTLYAIWQPNVFEIQFDDNVSEQEEDPVQGKMSALSLYYGVDTVIPECNWTRRGYLFAGWNTAADGSGTAYHANQKICISNEDQTLPALLYAIWEPMEGEIQYHINLPEHSSSNGKGEMKNTEYQYGNQWSLTPCSFEFPGYDFCSWNTKADGTGEFFQDGEEMYRKMAVSGVQNLYAVWKPKTDTRFYLRLEKQTVDTLDTYYEIMEMTGETDCLLSDAVLAYYRTQGEEVSLKDFIPGFTVMNSEEMEQNIVTANGQTMVTLVLERKKCKVQILRDASDSNSTCYASEEILYEDLFQFPDSVKGVQIKQYVDLEGNRYQPGESITVKQDSFFMMQHVLTYHEGDKIWEKYISHDMPYVLEKPEEKEYYFGAWYWDKTNRDFAGKAEDIIYLTEDCSLFAKWSEEKISYRIQYEWGNDSDIFFLDDPASQYQYGEQIVLPVASQLRIPMGYEFVGWYESGDQSKTMISEIDKDEYGDKTYCLLLRKKSVSEKNPGSETPEPGNASPEPGNGTTEPGNASPEPGNTTPEPDTDDQDGRKEDSQKQTDTSSTQANAGSSADTTSLGSQAVSPVHLSKGNVDKTSDEKFTKGKLTYRKIDSVKKSVSVTAVNTKAKRIQIPSYVTWKGIRYSVTRIEARAFSHCKNLKRVTIGKQVNQIGKKAFYGCKKLKTVIVSGKKIRKIQKNAFAKTNVKLQFSLPKKLQKKYISLLKKSNLPRIRIRS